MGATALRFSPDVPGKPRPPVPRGHRPSTEVRHCQQQIAVAATECSIGVRGDGGGQCVDEDSDALVDFCTVFVVLLFMRRTVDGRGAAAAEPTRYPERYRYAGRLRIWVFSGNPTPFCANARSTDCPTPSGSAAELCASATGITAFG